MLTLQVMQMPNPLEYTLKPQTPGYVEYRGKISRLCSGRRRPLDVVKQELLSKSPNRHSSMTTVPSITYSTTFSAIDL